MLKPTTTDIEALNTLDDRLRWLSAWTIHHANHIRESADGLKVGGHQASCASMTAIMAALYFHALGENDRVAVKPHAGPVLHAIHYLLGSQSREALEHFRALGGAQSYPSRTKDKIPVDFSTGSVGLGVAITLFASLVQDYLTAHGWLNDKDRGRFVALIGDAELDEGNVYEAIIEGAKHDVRNLWWIIDYNRQSLDATSADRMFERFDEIFRSCGWRVVELRYGKKLQAALDRHKAVREWFEKLSNAELSALHYQGGAAWRARIQAELGKKAAAFLKEYDDEALASLFTDLGGHCMESLVQAFDQADDDVPTLFVAWTIKGFGLPFAGHKDNHAGLMNPTQLVALRDAMGVREGQEWEPLEGVGDNARPGVEALLDRSRIARE
ncbi:MAG: transketolase, partial [Sphingomonas sp.]|nr:transketolase [Sphingomonas sp.]